MTQDGGAVADALHLFQTVADIKHRTAFGLQLLQRLEQLVGLLRRQHRGRLVENDEARVLQQGADDLDPLALTNRKIGHMRIGIERQAIGPRQRFRFPGDFLQ
ncbi:hypothetical protein D3C71_792730 [compost metagenome]